MTMATALAVLADGDSGPSLIVPHADGSLDTAFGQGGQVDPEPGYYGRYAAVAIQIDDKIVAVGAHYPSTGVDVLAFRFFPNGQPDNTFGVGGKVINPVPFSGFSFVNATAIQADGRILLAGGASGNDGMGRARLLD